MSVKAVSAQHYAALSARLAGIQDKRFLDDRWFDFDAQGHLTLVDRPLDCLSQIWECIVRFFTNKLADLEHEIVVISDQVDQYLKNERDPERLDQFLGRFTPALNELYRCAGRMQLAQRISEQALAHLNAKKNIQDFVIVPRSESGGAYHNGELVPGFCATGTIRLSNGLARATIVDFRFHNPSGTSWQSSTALSSPLLGSDAYEHTVCNNFAALNDYDEVHAKVSLPFLVNPQKRAYDVTIDKHGQPAVAPSARHEAEKGSVMIDNRSPHQVRFQVMSPGHKKDADVAPNTQTTVTLTGQQNLRCLISYELPVQRFATTFKDGFYTCEVDRDGLHVRAGLSPQLHALHRKRQAEDGKS